MIKKTVTLLIVAVLAVTLTEFDTERFITELFHKENSEKFMSVPLYEGDRKVFIGMDESKVFAEFGEPCDILKSEYGFSWNIFHDDFKNYIQIGTQSGKVVGIYTNSPEFSFMGIKVGTSLNDVYLAFETTLDHIKKGNTKYITNGIGEENSGIAVFLEHGMYITVFYDLFKNNSVTSINIIDYDTEQSFDRIFALPAPELYESFERLNFYAANALRVREGLKPFEYSEQLSEIALIHSEEMAENEYFDHTDLSGGSVPDRAEAAGIKYGKIGENIAMGAQNSVYMHEMLMNSEGHRRNLLDDFTHMGVGVSFSYENVPYLTQNFLR